MAKRKTKAQVEAEAPVEVAQPVEAPVEATQTQEPQSYTQLVSNLVCRLNELAGDNYNRQAVVKQAEKLLLQYESSALQSTIQYCFAELDVQQPTDIKWGVVINAIRDAVTLAQK